MKCYGIIGLMILSLLSHSAWAGMSQLNALKLDESGRLQFKVSGEGFDPLFSVKSLPGSVYQVTCRGEHVQLNPQIRQSFKSFQTTLRRKYPTVTMAELTEEKNAFRLVLSTRKKLLPQVRANADGQITISLITVGANHPQAAVKNPAEDERSGTLDRSEAIEALGTVELSLDERLEKRKKQEYAQKALVKAQEELWEHQKEDKADQLASNREISSALIAPPKIHSAPISTTPFKTAVQPATFTPVDPDEDNGPAPVKLTTPPASLMSDEGGAISEASLYAFLDQPEVDPTIRSAVRQALDGQSLPALEALQQYASKQPDSFPGRYALVMLLLNTSNSDSNNTANIEKAKRILQQLIADASYLPAYWPLIELQIDSNQLSDAESLLQKAQLLAPEHPMFFYLSGKLNENQKKPERAQTLYRQALAKAPYLTEAHYRLAQIALKTGHLEQAEWELRQVLQVISDDSRCLKLLGFIAQQQKHPEVASLFYQKALQPDVILNEARLLAAQKQNQKALSLLSAVDVFCDNNPDLLFNLGMTYADLHFTAQAKSTLSRFLKTQNNSSNPQVSQAQTTLRQLR